jgi:hypothetical protein
MFDAWDSQLADNQSPRNPRNRNTVYASGQRINVAEFNASLADQDPVKKGATRSDAKVTGRTLAAQLAMARANAKKAGKPFDAARATRWFRVKDLNQDGVLSEKEQKTKAPVGWNTIK